MNEIRRLRTGMPVADVGNRPLGRVEAIGDASFEVDVWNDGTVWLREDALFWVGAQGATLVCDGERIQYYET